MTLFDEAPVNNLEYTILRAEMWSIKTDLLPTYYHKHSATEAWRYRNTPAKSEEVWCPEFNKI